VEQYLIRVRGTLPSDVLADFVELAVTSAWPQTILRGELKDQDALVDTLDRLDELGVVVLEVLQLSTGPPDETVGSM
jgi:hypothetical protein